MLYWEDIAIGSAVDMGLQCSMTKCFKILLMYRDCESDIFPSLVILLTSIPKKQDMGPKSVIGNVEI